MRIIKIFLLFVCCISLDVQSQTFLSDTLGINEDGSVIIAKSLALPGWILGVDVDSTDNLLFIRYRNLSKNETSLKIRGEFPFTPWLIRGCYGNVLSIILIKIQS